jgi:2-polyprenyl-6-methoxyphenol hydroxylase-like FAD-dependent oxidoreductase
MPASLDALQSSYDAVIVGARCAGAATAMLLARAGLDVLVVEQGARGTDTLSTLALMRGGVLQLSRWGLLDAIKRAGTPRIATTTFYYGAEPVEIRIKPRDGVDGLYAPRRTVLDPLLADAAEAAGAQMAYRVRLNGLVRAAGGRVAGVQVESGGRARRIAAAIVIGADGVASTVAKEVGAEPYRVGRHMSSTIYTRARGLGLEGSTRQARASASSRPTTARRWSLPRRPEIASCGSCDSIWRPGSARSFVRRRRRWRRRSTTRRHRRTADLPGIRDSSDRHGAPGGHSSATPAISRIRSPRTGSPMP